MKTRVCLNYFMSDCLSDCIWKQIFASNLPTDTVNFDLLDNFCNSKAFDTVFDQQMSKRELKLVLEFI